MECVSLYYGSWFPKTIIHLKEFETFIRGQYIDPLLDMEEATRLYLLLEPSQIQTDVDVDGFKYVMAQSGPFHYRYFSDGLLVIESPATALEENTEEIKSFYDDQIVTLLSFLNSRGARDVHREDESTYPHLLFIHCRAASDPEIRKFFRVRGEQIHSTHTYQHYALYYGDNFVLINEKEGEGRPLDIHHLVEYLTLFQEVKRHSYNFLRIHRSLWESADHMLKHQFVRVRDLPRFNKVLTDLSNEADTHMSHIELMRLNFNARVDRAKKDRLMFTKLLANFENIHENLEHLKNLMAMTRQHIHNSNTHLSTMYEEKQEEALNRLQFLFLLSVTAGLVNLGAFKRWDGVAELGNYGFFAFTFGSLLWYGLGSLLITMLIYYLWNYTFQHVRARLKR